MRTDELPLAISWGPDFPGAAREPQQSPHSMLPSLRENRLHRCHQTRLSESEANFSIIRNTFDRQLQGGGDEPGDSG